MCSNTKKFKLKKKDTSYVFTIIRGDDFWFGSVFTYKNNQIEILYNTKNKIKTESKSVQTEQFRFNYFILKTETQPTDFGSVQFGFGAVRFSFGLV
jgi:hypothetical protein